MSDGTTRPGGRTARVRAAVVQAAGDALVEVGVAGIDLADVARRAGVGKTTVYRRWGTVSAVVADLVDDMVDTSAPRADTGSLAGDLRANAHLVRSTLAEPRQGALLAALICATRDDEHAGAAWTRFYDARVDVWAPCVIDAIERGELQADTDPHEVIRAVAAPLYHRFLLLGRVPAPSDADRAAAAALAAARAGVYSPDPAARPPERPGPGPSSRRTSGGGDRASA